MKISFQERIDIQTAIKIGHRHGFGNIIAHLQTAWARKLMEGGLSEKASRRSTALNGRGYPFAMQDDLIGRGEWDETGARYAKQQR